ncbi:hypothetical protein LINPERPRIM_LOCUS29999, partial [Linum perenne]
QATPIPPPAKCRDPGAFTLLCTINNVKIDRSLIDLGSAINVMPTCLFEKLNLGELKPLSMHLVFADRSVKLPRGLLEDVVVRCGPFTILTDFVVMDTREEDVTVFLGRPFMATA